MARPSSARGTHHRGADYPSRRKKTFWYAESVLAWGYPTAFTIQRTGSLQTSLGTRLLSGAPTRLQRSNAFTVPRRHPDSTYFQAAPPLLRPTPSQATPSLVAPQPSGTKRSSGTCALPNPKPTPNHAPNPSRPDKFLPNPIDPKRPSRNKALPKPSRPKRSQSSRQSKPIPEQTPDSQLPRVLPDTCTFSEQLRTLSAVQHEVLRCVLCDKRGGWMASPARYSSDPFLSCTNSEQAVLRSRCAHILFFYVKLSTSCLHHLHCHRLPDRHPRHQTLVCIQHTRNLIYKSISLWKCEHSHTTGVSRACACCSPRNEFATFSSTIAIVFEITIVLNLHLRRLPYRDLHHQTLVFIQQSK